MATKEWRECAWAPCSKIFAPSDRPGWRQACCSQSCGNKLAWQTKRPDRIAARAAVFFAQPEVADDRDAIERAFWRVFGS